MNEDNDGCVTFLKRQRLTMQPVCKNCGLEITTCDQCGNPVVFEHDPVPSKCPLITFFRNFTLGGLREYDVCDKCGDHVCPECQDNAKVGWGVFDALCKKCGKRMKKNEYMGVKG
jgi:hypothetical protein